ncbi:MAG: GIY-YIG nuclease family protein [Proteobacteria bacterium]|nr:GIY-YIG nuclease family protein [Pseudomonadota bacterium]
MANAWHVYMIECSDGTLYTGVTLDLGRRLREHNAGSGSKYTRSRRPVRLVHSEARRGRASAQRREAAIKALTRGEKMLLCRDNSVDTGRRCQYHRRTSAVRMKNRKSHEGVI